MSGDSEHSVDDVDDAVDGADVLLVDGRVDASGRHRHSLLARSVVEPDAVVRQRRRSGIGLEDFKDDFCLKIKIKFLLESKCICNQEFQKEVFKLSIVNWPIVDSQNKAPHKKPVKNNMPKGLKTESNLY